MGGPDIPIINSMYPPPSTQTIPIKTQTGLYLSWAFQTNLNFSPRGADIAFSCRRNPRKCLAAAGSEPLPIIKAHFTPGDTADLPHQHT